MQEGETAPSQTALTLDAVSRATGSISGGSSDGSSGGYAISTDFLFKGDLIANACVLNKLNKDTAESTAVLEYWNYSTSTLDSAFNKGDTMYYSGTDYMSHIYGSKAEAGKLWKPFAAYAASAAASVNPPHATKEVMEDGLLGDVLDSSVSGKLDYITPDSGKYAEGDDVVLRFTADGADDYISKITGLYLNGDWRELGEDYCTINTENNTITIKKELLHIGENALKIVSGGYKEQNVTFTYEKANENVTGLTISADKAGQPVTITINGSDGDFLKNLSAVTLKQGDDVDNVYWYGYEGSTAVYYVKTGANTLTLYNVKPGTYTVTLSAQYYNDLSTDFTMAGTAVVNPAPDMTTTISEDNGVYTVNFDGKKNTAGEDITTGKDVSNWALAVTKVTVNDKEYAKLDGINSILTEIDKDSAFYKSGAGSYGGYDFILGGSAFKDGENKVVISAKGYKDLTVTITKNSGGSTPEPSNPDKPSEGTVAVPTTAPTVKSTGVYSSKYILDFSNNKAWVNKITSIKLGGSACKPVDSANNVYSGNYYLDTENGYIYMYLSIYSDTKLVIAADGCDKLVLTAASGSGWNAPPVITYVGTASAEPSAAPTIAKIEKVPASFITASFYRVSFSDDEIEDYLNGVKKVTLDNSVELKSGSIYDDSTKTFKIGTESASGAKNYLDLSTDCFTEGDTIVTVKADDYKDLTFTVTVDADGNLSIK